MNKKIFYPIPSLCYCGCNEITWNGNKYIKNHCSKSKENRIKSRDRLLGKQTKGMTGKIPWNKGLTAKEDIRILVGKNHWDCSGINNPQFGKKIICSQETKDKISIAHVGKKGLCGEDNPMFGRCGELNPSWKGGISFLPYCIKFNKKLKEKIRNRDGRICWLCGKTEPENHRKLDVHHIHYDKENCYPDLISLCISCNSKVNSNRDYWEDFFMKILKYRELLNN